MQEHKEPLYRLGNKVGRLIGAAGKKGNKRYRGIDPDTLEYRAQKAEEHQRYDMPAVFAEGAPQHQKCIGFIHTAAVYTVISYNSRSGENDTKKLPQLLAAGDCYSARHQAGYRVRRYARVEGSDIEYRLALLQQTIETHSTL